MKPVFLILIFLLFSGCATRTVRFEDRAPVRYFNDIHPIPLPEAVRSDRFDYYATVKPPRPNFRSIPRLRGKLAKDVNALDEVPASSWFLPRLSAYSLSPAEVVAGPAEYGPPVPPVEIIRVRKVTSNPRLFVRDQRNMYYLLKFDPPDFPGIATATSFMTNRLFWCFGYNVPEDQLFFFRRQDIRTTAERKISAQQLNQILQQFGGGNPYRAIASRIIEGLPLGPTPEKGVRAEDPNDLFPHEDRRVLRALRVFCAFTNMPDISRDNLLDIYVGAPGAGYIKHYFVDFDDAFGTHVARHNELWAGYNHVFSLRDILKNFATLGLVVEDWEKITPTPWKSVGTFESRIFDPAKWKETHPFLPIRRSQPADNYWAAKILAELTPAHLAALVAAARFPEPAAADYVRQTLIDRRNKILNYYLRQVSPIEFIKSRNDQIHFQNLAKKLGFADSTKMTHYQIRFIDDRRNELAPVRQIRSESTELILEIKPALFARADDYLIVEIQVMWGEKPAPAQFHFVTEKTGAIDLVGVIH